MAEAATTTTTQTTPPADQTWWSGLDDETKGYVQNKGLSTKPINEAFTAVSKFHREAERMIGAPAGELVRLPKEANSPDWSQVYKRLGALDKPEDYKFENVKHVGDKPISEAMVDTLRKAAHGAHLSPDAAAIVAKEIVTYQDRLDAARQADEAAALAKGQKDLKDNWGVNFETNKFVASGAFNTLTKALGISEGDSKAALENMAKNLGYDKVMDLFRIIGTKIGEDKFVLSPGGGSSAGVMTKESATAEKAELMRDEAWRTRYLKGGTEENRKMLALNTIISSKSA